MTLLPAVLTGAASVTVTAAAPRLPLLNQIPLPRPVTQAVVAFGGGMLVGQFFGKKNGVIWTIVGVATIAAEFIGPMLAQWIPGLSAFPTEYLSGLGQERSPLELEGPSTMSAYPTETMSGVGMYPAVPTAPF